MIRKGNKRRCATWWERKTAEIDGMNRRPENKKPDQQSA
jgi:hypothetical protein